MAEKIDDLEKQLFELILTNDVNRQEAHDVLKKFKSASRISGAKSFAKMVKEMRTLQRMFFNGDKTVIDKAKATEKRVDTALDAIEKTYK